VVNDTNPVIIGRDSVIATTSKWLTVTTKNIQHFMCKPINRTGYLRDALYCKIVYIYFIYYIHVR